jgi:branched-chain amino acid transport system substrate-binding protein
VPIANISFHTMHLKLTLTLLALTASLAVGASAALAGTTGRKDDPGITPKTILLGGTTPLTGLASPYSSISKGAEAYFKYVNARGGVNGRMILYKVLDDGYNSAQTLTVTRQLVEQDKVFAIFNALGTENNLAVRPYLNQAKVPQLFVGSGGTTFGRDYDQFPDTIGFQPTYQSEGWVYGKYLAHMAPGATIAVLFQKDDYGKDLLIGLKRGLQRSKAKVIAAQPYDPLTSADVSAQMAKLKASGADTLAIFATSAFVAQAYSAAAKLGWKPKHVINNSVGASSTTMAAASDGGRNKLVAGTISIAYLKDPNDAQWAKDKGMKLYRQILARYAPGEDPADAQHVYGMAVAWTAVEALRKVGATLTREALLQVLDKLNLTGNPFLLPGIAVKTAAKDHYPIEQMLLQRWQNGAWKQFGGLWTYRSQ